jgi:GT2 family glycosyltransferase
MPPCPIHTVIVTHNASRWVGPLLESCVASTLVHTVIVVDNASTDDTCDIVRQRFPGVRLEALDENIGFGQANNIGVCAALDAGNRAGGGAKYVFLLNQDAKIGPDTLEHLVAAADRHERFGIFSPVHLTYDGDALDPLFTRFVALGESRAYFSDLHTGQVADVYEVGFLPAAAWLIRANVLEKVGGFDPIFFMYNEDRDLLDRMNRAGHGLAMVPAARFCHHHGGDDWNVQSPEKRMWMRFGEMVIELKNPAHSFAGALARLTRDTLADALRWFFRARWPDLRLTITAFCRVLCHLPHARRSRLRAQTETPLFLSIPRAEKTISEKRASPPPKGPIRT